MRHDGSKWHEIVRWFYQQVKKAIELSPPAQRLSLDLASVQQSNSWLDVPDWFASNKGLALEALIDLAEIMQCGKGDELCAVFRGKRGSLQQPRKATGDRRLFKQCVHDGSNICAVSNQRQRA
jgi:hypothetical protein